MIYFPTLAMKWVRLLLIRFSLIKDREMTEHTPGPWSIETDVSGIYVMTPGQGIAKLYDVTPTQWIKDRLMSIGEANARLIAAAPELLEALEETLRALEVHLDDDTNHCGLKHRDLLCPCNQNEVVRARATIAKAKGE